jgi:hypothetical protein
MMNPCATARFSAPRTPLGGRPLIRTACCVAGAAALLEAAVSTGCASSATADSAAQPDPVRLLAVHPALPSSWILTGFPGKYGARRAIHWRETRGPARTQSSGCDGAFREWSERGVEDAMPDVWENVCAFGSTGDARDAYDSQSLYVVGGEGWPNFEPGANARTRPRGIGSLDSLRPDQWELGCGVGYPNGVCAVWTFRSRYGRDLVDVEFAASAGGIRFPAMRKLLFSIDRHIASALK